MDIWVEVFNKYKHPCVIIDVPADVVIGMLSGV